MQAPEAEGKTTTKRRRSSEGLDGAPVPNKRQKKPFNREEWEKQRNARQATASNLTGRNAVQFSELFVTFYKVCSQTDLFTT